MDSDGNSCWSGTLFQVCLSMRAKIGSDFNLGGFFQLVKINGKLYGCARSLKADKKRQNGRGNEHPAKKSKKVPNG